MATYTNQTKNTSTFTNLDFGSINMIWSEAIFAWEDADRATWETPYIPFVTLSKNTSTFTNQTKN